jgi:CDP-2,3-bis-(O-geranylgeranyl)-sn-glycerol synthase
MANMAPSLVQWFPWTAPISKRYLGPNKTWRGFIAGVCLAVVTVFLQTALFEITFFKTISIIQYEYRDCIVLGILFGGGALVGDALKSFIKRQMGKEPGSRWFPWDQIDFIIGATLFSALLVNFPPLEVLVIALVLTVFLHMAVNWIGYQLKLKNVPW